MAEKRDPEQKDNKGCAHVFGMLLSLLMFMVALITAGMMFVFAVNVWAGLIAIPAEYSKNGIASLLALAAFLCSKVSFGAMRRAGEIAHENHG